MADRKISDLTALTTPAAGDYLPIVDISEVAAASKNKRITIEELFRGVPLGTAAAPSIAIEGDENTGIYSPGADQVAISTNGTGRLFVDASGNIGVGVASPVTTLHLQKPTGGLAGIQVSTSTHGSTLTDGLFVGIDNSLGYLYNYENLPLVFGTNSTERLRITSTGLVGIGTTAPDTILHTAVSQAGSAAVNIFKAQATNTTNNVITRLDLSAEPALGTASVLRFSAITGNAADSSNMAFNIRNASVSTEVLRISSSGRVGIGTTSPQGPIEIQGSQFAYFRNNCAGQTPAGSIGTGMVALGTNVQASDGGAALVYGVPYGASGFDIASWDGSTYTRRFRIDNSGRVGIGTTAPDNRLHVVSTSAGQPSARFTDGSNSTLLIGHAATNLTYLDAYTNLGFYISGSERARIDASGRLGLGTSSPGALIDITDSAPEARISSSNTAQTLGSSVGKLTFYTSDTTTPGGAGVATTLETLSSTSNGSDYRFVITKREGSGGGSCFINLGGSADGSISFGTNTSGAGTERLRIDSSGRVGLGTSSPASLLHLAATNTSPPELKIQNTSSGTGDTASISFTMSSVAGASGALIRAERLGASAQSALSFWTGSAGGNNVRALTIDQAQRVGIGTTTPGAPLHVQSDAGGVSEGLRLSNESTFATIGRGTQLTFRGTGGGLLGSITAGTATAANDQGSLTFAGNGANGLLTFQTNSVERARIDSSGRLLVGTSASRNVGSTVGRIVQIEGTSATTTGLTITRNSADTTGTVITLGKSRSASNGGSTVLLANDSVGALQFAGADGTDLETVAASISCDVDGTPGSNDMPGRLVFSTTADGSATPTERMRIKNNGTINFSNVATYADNTAALAGGLVAGDVYRKSDGTLMITY